MTMMRLSAILRYIFSPLFLWWYHDYAHAPANAISNAMPCNNARAFVKASANGLHPDNHKISLSNGWLDMLTVRRAGVDLP